MIAEPTHENIVSVDTAEIKGFEYLPSKQSANTLFHFFKESGDLFGSLQKEALVPRYYPETVDYLDIDMLHIAYPMFCFCDINLHKMDDHMAFYGGYGIAFSKQWGMQNGIQPLQYINPHSFLHHDFSVAFKSAMKSEAEDFAQNYLLSQMYYLKPIVGTMKRDGREMTKNFTDECEWRYIPNVKVENLPQAVSEAEIFSLPTLNKTISIKESCWLKYKLNDVKYIIVQTNEEFTRLNEIIEMKSINREEKNKLISKILIWNNVKGDF